MVTTAVADYTQQAAPQQTWSDLATASAATTTLTSVIGGFTPSMSGHVLNLSSVGTNALPGFYQIVTFTNGNTVVLDRACSTSTGLVGGSGAVGGALATLAQLATAVVASNKAYATGAFTSVATTTFAPGNVNPAGGAAPTRLIGYGSVRGDTGHATLTLSTNTGLTGLTCGNNGFFIEQFDVDCASLGTSTGISSTGTNSGVRNCKVSNFTTRGINVLTNAGHGIYDCEATGGGAAATSALQVGNAGETITRCFVHDNACPGIVTGAGGIVTHNLVVNNSGASSDGVTPGNVSLVMGNTIHNNGRDGIRMGGSITLGPQQWRNNILSSNGGYGASLGALTAIPATPDLDGNAYFANTSGTRNNMDSTTGIFGITPYTNIRDVILTTSPYLGPTSGTGANFALNNAPGGGRACRGVASPTVWSGNTGSAGALDMGAVQHRDQSVPTVITGS